MVSIKRKPPGILEKIKTVREPRLSLTKRGSYENHEGQKRPTVKLNMSGSSKTHNKENLPNLSSSKKLHEAKSVSFVKEEPLDENEPSPFCDFLVYCNHDFSEDKEASAKA